MVKWRFLSEMKHILTKSNLKTLKNTPKKCFIGQFFTIINVLLKKVAFLDSIDELKDKTALSGNK